MEEAGKHREIERFLFIEMLPCCIIPDMEVLLAVNSPSEGHDFSGIPQDLPVSNELLETATDEGSYMTPFEAEKELS